MRINTYIFGALTVVSSTIAWGELGHRTVAYLAYRQLSSSSRQYIDSVLAFEKGQDISDIAIWADAVRREKKYSAPWHFIGQERQDDPPSNCSLIYPADCDPKSGCIVSAIDNHTGIFVDSAPSLTTKRKEALYFIIHFFGDIHQPLHAENKFRGGNDLPVCFRGSCDRVNLHSVWDDYIPRAMRGIKVDPNIGEPPAGEEKSAAHKWAEDLLKSRGPGSPFERGCVDVSRAEFCATSLAVESNGLVCTYVMAKGVDWLRGRDLGKDYYDGAIPIVEGQIHRAGVRLADWLDAMVKASQAAAAARIVSGNLEL